MKYRQFRGDDEDDDVPLQRLSNEPKQLSKTMEAQIQKDDTLQAIALRYHCTVAELKRLNKIDKDNEIHARTVLHVPINPYNLLLPEFNDFNNAPIHKTFNKSDPVTVPQPSTSKDSNQSINDIILNTQLKSNQYTDSENVSVDENEITESTKLNTQFTENDISNPIVLRKRNELFSCSGSDWDISWICLLILILALCVAIPLIYVVYIAEHPEEFHHKSAELHHENTSGHLKDFHSVTNTNLHASQDNILNTNNANSSG